MLLSTTGFTVNQHFCGNRLVDTALFVRAKPCKMEAAKTGCAKHPKARKNGCCKDHSDYYQLDQDQQLTQPFYKPLQPPAVCPAILPEPAFLPAAPSPVPALLAYLHYRPPLIVQRAQARLQIFRL